MTRKTHTFTSNKHFALYEAKTKHRAISMINRKTRSQSMKARMEIIGIGTKVACKGNEY